jgi:hypothetical protein
MRDVLILFLHLIVTIVRLARPGGLRSVVAEAPLVKHCDVPYVLMIFGFFSWLPVSARRYPGGRN